MNEYSLPPIILSFNIYMSHSPLLRVKFAMNPGGGRGDEELTATFPDEADDDFPEYPMPQFDESTSIPLITRVLYISLRSVLQASTLLLRQRTAPRTSPSWPAAHWSICSGCVLAGRRDGCTGTIVPFASSSESACAWALVLTTQSAGSRPTITIASFVDSRGR